jgi:hypothetical protein
MAEIHTVIAEHLELNFQSCKQEVLEKETDIWLQNHAKVDFDQIKFPYILSHLVRDCREIVVSGYHYHKKCTEPHVVNSSFLTRFEKFRRKTISKYTELHFLLDEKWKNKSYQDILNQIDTETGIHLEILLKASSSFRRMNRWDYDNPKCLNLKFEEMINDFNNNIKHLLHHYKIHESAQKKIIEKARIKNPLFWNKDKVHQSHHVNSSSIVTQDRKPVFKTDKWRDIFTERNKEIFKENFGELLIKLGYEKDNNW